MGFVLKHIVVLGLSLILGSFSYALEYEIQGQKFNIYTPNNWQSAKDLLGADLTLLGPYSNKRRSVVSIDASPLENFKFNESQLEQSQQEYKNQRKEFMKKSNGKAIKFYNYKKLSWQHVKEVHTVGYYYEVLNKKFHERNYFFNCKNKLYTVTTLMTDNQLRKDGQELLKVIRSINCK